MTDKNIKATVNAIQNTLKSNGISMSFLDLDTLPVEATSFSVKKGTWRVLRNLASKLAELCRFSDE